MGSKFSATVLPGGIVIAVSIGLILKARAAFQNESLVPEKTIQTLKDEKDWASNKIKS